MEHDVCGQAISSHVDHSLRFLRFGWEVRELNIQVAIFYYMTKPSVLHSYPGEIILPCRPHRCRLSFPRSTVVRQCTHNRHHGKWVSDSSAPDADARCWAMLGGKQKLDCAVEVGSTTCTIPQGTRCHVAITHGHWPMVHHGTSTSQRSDLRMVERTAPYPSPHRLANLPFKSCVPHF